MLLRAYEPHDFSAIFKLDQSCFPPGIAYSKTTLRYFLTLPSAESLLAVSGKDLAGFILSEVNLGILGLGVAEPLPSWGSLLKELEGLVSVGEEPWKFVPLVMLVVVVTSFQLVLSKQEEAAR